MAYIRPVWVALEPSVSTNGSTASHNPDDKIAIVTTSGQPLLACERSRQAGRPRGPGSEPHHNLEIDRRERRGAQTNWIESSAPQRCADRTHCADGPRKRP